ncbi:MAG TPA: GMC oxidoreductase [Thermoanaerobaculia bacterium]|jgi:cholesterol oxidase|nr:GMC oxidoreductase [Thermoanaerobaculia bacterium]
MERLSSPLEALKAHYTVVVIGSGYGGGIAASRLARAGQSVCLLERGREMHPGEYPTGDLEAAQQVQLNTPGGHVGSRLGMFEFHVNENQNALVGCGLGGTSLINANVALRAVPGVWAEPAWPTEIRADLATLLEDGYLHAEAMLQPQPYPATYPPLAKLDALQKSAEALGDGERFYRPPINVSFVDHLNPAGVAQKACINCGDCVGGCNHWAKNTTLMNYVPDAKRHGAEIFTQAAVRWIERRPDDTWVVHFQVLGSGREVFDAPEFFVTADIVVVSAGTLGSSEILLRSKQKGLRVSDQLGKHFSGNGDVLAFAYNCDPPIHGIGFGARERGEGSDVGPCIAGIIDWRDVAPVADGFVVEEGSVPGCIAPLLPAGFALAAQAVGIDTDSGIVDRVQEKARALESLVRGAYHGAVDHTQIYLVMSHDRGVGELALRDDRIRIDWPGVGTESGFQRVNDYLNRTTAPLGGTFVKDPIWTEPFKDSLITVHPLGGCRMAEGAETGVVNHKGEVFVGATGAEVHPGLYVTDGSVVPVSLGVNPLLTISAISERAILLLARDRGWTIDYSPITTEAVPAAPVSHRLGIRFTETMRGFASTVVTPDFEAAYDQGKEAKSGMDFTLTIESDNLDALIEQPAHTAKMYGTVACGALSPTPLVVHDGAFGLFVDNAGGVDVKNMTYRMKLQSVEGKFFFFYGFKKITDATILAAWPQTTTLYTTVYEGTDDQGRVVAKGILHISPTDFLRQMTTMKVLGGEREEERLKGVVRFGKFFAGVLWNAYGGAFVGESYFNPAAPPREKRQLRAGAPELHPFRTSDGVDLLLTRYQGGNKGPILLVHGAGVSSGIFSTDLIETNLLEFLYAHGYDVWLFDFRISIALPASNRQCNGDQIATIDHPEAVARILAATGASTVQAVVHCYGANTFYMALLAGLGGVRSVVCSQVATDLICEPLTKFKTGLHVPEFLDKLGIESLTAYVTSTSSWKQKLFDDVLRLYPVPEGESCHDPVCHRVTFMYSLLYQHEQLTERFHQNLHELFGIGNMATFEHLATMVRTKHVVSHVGEDVYLPHLDRLNIPMRFIHGENNHCYEPESTLLTLNRLAAANGPALYDRFVIANYGHLDCIFGKNAVTEVYPLILEHLERTL